VTNTTPRTLLLPALLLCAFGLRAESGYEAWLRYEPLPDAVAQTYLQTTGASVTLLGTSPVLLSARAEFLRGVRGMLGRTLRQESALPPLGGVIIGSLRDIDVAMPESQLGSLPDEGFRIKTVQKGAARYLVVAGGAERGALYGVFALLRKISLREPLSAIDEQQSPYAPVRWVNHWDNLNGSIERGYGGSSIFWENGRARSDLTRVSDYGRLLASLGIQACSINNVNADQRMLSTELLPDIARIAGAFRPWGVRIAISIDFGSPKSMGGLDTFDPLEPRGRGEAPPAPVALTWAAQEVAKLPPLTAKAPQLAWKCSGTHSRHRRAAV